MTLRLLHLDAAGSLARAAAENCQSYLYNAPDVPAPARNSIERALERRALGQRIPFTDAKI